MNPEDLTDEPVNAGNRAQLNKKAERDLAHLLEQENDLRAILATEQGRRLLVRVFDICGMDEEYLQPNHSIMSATAGRRQVARQIRDWIRTIRPDGFALWSKLDEAWQAYRYPMPASQQRAARGSVKITPAKP